MKNESVQILASLAMLGFKTFSLRRTTTVRAYGGV